MNADRKHLDAITERVIGCAFTVANALGAGFLEKVYENALAHELKKAGLIVGQQIAIDVQYHSVTVGAYIADLLVENAVLVEIKAVRALDILASRSGVGATASDPSALAAVGRRRSATCAQPLMDS